MECIDLNTLLIIPAVTQTHTIQLTAALVPDGVDVVQRGGAPQTVYTLSGVCARVCVGGLEAAGLQAGGRRGE